MSQERRETLKIIGAIGSTCAFPFSSDELYGQHAGHAAVALQQAALPPPRFFTKAELETIMRLADLIIPATDTPGAVAAGVPAYIDFVVTDNDRLKKLYRDGLAWLDTQARKSGGKRFVDLGESKQVAIMTPLCEEADQPERPREQAGVAFFRAVKGMTADGFFTSKEGLVDALKYTGNTVLSKFPACTHEH